ncbi:MAG: hypothetical protein LiPW15_263 [Parcubacteria group bacterium LiPW_15]|nr:MAG: hypothetical protein LiPW15_263 [Parcubacteria group bacterium LiPW_15]
MKKLGYLFVGLVAIVIIFGLWSIGGPGAAKMQRMDDQRISDLQNLQSQIIYYWQGKQKLPATLEGLVDSTRGVYVPVDPETGAAYSYKTTGDLSFELCAKFAKEYKLSTPISVAPYDAKPTGLMAGSWDHPVGDYCFARTIDRDFYPPIKKF